MRTVFGLFSTYEDARDAVVELLDNRIDRWDIHAVMQKLAAENATAEQDRSRVKVEKSIPVTGSELRGLDRMIAGMKAVRLPEVGEVYAAGDLASHLVRTAMTSTNGAGGSMKAALVDAGIGAAHAAAIQKGLSAGGVLVMARVADERAPEAGEIMRRCKASLVTG